jgi:hypothetical protein
MKIKGPNNTVWVTNCVAGCYNSETGMIDEEGYHTIIVDKGLIVGKPVSPVGGCYTVEQLEGWGFVGLYEPAK